MVKPRLAGFLGGAVAVVTEDRILVAVGAGRGDEEGKDAVYLNGTLISWQEIGAVWAENGALIGRSEATRCRDASLRNSESFTPAAHYLENSSRPFYYTRPSASNQGAPFGPGFAPTVMLPNDSP